MSPQHRQSSIPRRTVQHPQLLPRFCHDQQSQKPIKSFRVGIVQLLMLFALAFRVGEAAQPGPYFGNFNPTGLNSKSSDLHELPMGVYAVQVSNGDPEVQTRIEMATVAIPHGTWSPCTVQRLVKQSHWR